MSNTLDGANAVNEDADFFETGDPSYYEESGEGEQLYLNSVLPQAYDPVPTFYACDTNFHTASG